MKNNRRHSSEKGQSFTELAISMMFLLLLLAGTLDLGRIFFTFTALRDAVQEGASYLAMYPTRCSEALIRVRDHTTQPVDLSSADILVKLDVDGKTCAAAPAAQICPGDDIEVTVEFTNFRLSAPLVNGVAVPLKVSVVDSVLVDPDPYAGPPCP